MPRLDPCPSLVPMPRVGPSLGLGAACSMFDGFPALVVFLGEGMVIRYVNHRIADLVPIEPRDVIGRSVLEWVHPDDAPRAVRQVERAVQVPGAVWPAMVRYPTEGGWAAAATRAVGYETGPWGAGVLLLVEDLAQEAPPDLLGGVNLSWEGTLVLRGDEATVGGATFREAAGLPTNLPFAVLLEHLQPLRDERGRAVAVDADDHPLRRASRGEPLRAEVVQWDAPGVDGTPLWLELTTLPAGAWLERDGRVASLRVRHVSRERHILERLERAHTAVAEADADRLVELALLAHELRNPLATVLALGELIGGSVVDDEVRDRFATQIVASAREMVRTIDALMEPPGTATPPDGGHRRLRDVAEEVRDRHVHRLRSGVVLRVDDLPEVEVVDDAVVRPLISILTRFVENAIEHTARGEVVVGADLDATAGELRAWVRDTGPGMEPSVVVDVLESEHGRMDRDGGRGLGLWVARSLAARLGGELRICSRPGDGTTVGVVLPARLVRPVERRGGDPRAG